MQVRPWCLYTPPSLSKSLSQRPSASAELDLCLLGVTSPGLTLPSFPIDPTRAWAPCPQVLRLTLKELRPVSHWDTCPFLLPQTAFTVERRNPKASSSLETNYRRQRPCDDGASRLSSISRPQELGGALHQGSWEPRDPRPSTDPKKTSVHVGTSLLKWLLYHIRVSFLSRKSVHGLARP